MSGEILSEFFSSNFDLLKNSEKTVNITKKKLIAATKFLTTNKMSLQPKNLL